MQLPKKAISTRYDYSKIVPWFQNKATQLIGKEFLIPDSDRAIIIACIAWCLQNDLVAMEMGFDLDKGIILSGPIGCGKTTLFKIMQNIPSDRRGFNIISTRQIVSEFMLMGYNVLETYSRGNLSQVNRRPRNYCFDDLGSEMTSKYFGNNCNVMAEILLTRYDLFKDKKVMTHLTTNLSSSEIETQYGNRVRSRMREMFNLFGYDEIVKDKRM